MNALMLLALLAKYNTKQFWEVPPLLEQYLIALNNKRLYGTSILLISFKHLIIYRIVCMYVCILLRSRKYKYIRWWVAE